MINFNIKTTYTKNPPCKPMQVPILASVFGVEIFPCGCVTGEKTPGCRGLPVASENMKHTWPSRKQIRAGVKKAIKESFSEVADKMTDEICEELGMVRE